MDAATTIAFIEFIVSLVVLESICSQIGQAWMDKDTSTECSTESKAEPDPRDAEGGEKTPKGR